VLVIKQHFGGSVNQKWVEGKGDGSIFSLSFSTTFLGRPLFLMSSSILYALLI